MRFGAAILLSLLAHAVLAALLVAYSEFSSGPLELAKLDLSSVDLSFAEEEDDSAAAQPALPSAASAPVPEAKPPEPEPPPELEPPKELPPDPEAMKLPEPEEARPPMETPAEPKPEKAPEEKKPEEKPKEEPRPASAAFAPVVAAAPRRARVDAQPRLRRTIEPDYPKGARQRGEQGDVTLEIVVAETGRVGDVKIVQSSGFHELDEAARTAVKKARFTPAKQGARAVESVARITLTFRLK
jgi:periplasmic protein TonB